MAAQLHLIPAVDVLGAEAVRLRRGDYALVVARADDPVALVRRFVAEGAALVHVVDLDGARSGRIRPELIRRLAAAAAPAAVQASGGVRRPRDVETLLAAGAARVVVGTAAFAAPTALSAYAAFGDRVAVAIDVRGPAGRVAVAGWRRDSGLGVDEAVERCVVAGIVRLLCTAVERDGTLEGPDLELLSRVVERSRLPVMAAGGIRSAADLAALELIGVEAAVVGRALLDGRVAVSGTGSSGQPG